MNQKRRLTNLAKRWNIPLRENMEFSRFRNRLLAELDRTVGAFILQNGSIVREYQYVVGLPQAIRGTFSIGSLDRTFAKTCIYDQLADAGDVSQLAMSLQPFLWVLANNKYKEMDAFIERIRKVIDDSPLISLKVVKRGDEVTLYPGGAKLLDERVINDNLDWLENHPAASKHFASALEIYLKKDKSKYRNLLDELRSSLEKLVRGILGRKSNLENLGTPLLQWMEDKGAHVQIRNLFEKLLACYTQYHNDAVKHGEGWSEKDIEYMIYQTGVFMRLLLVLNGEDRS